ncbi:MAG: hypothetical protein K0R55_2276 [Sporomusa sp.]|jgi:hypothetical protein|nr:hypothetical protein [Sporomusa sp.]
MRNKFIAFTITTAIGGLTFLGSIASALDAPTVNRYVLEVPEKFYVSYEGSNKSAFSHGFRTGFGSGISVKSVNKDGSIEFYMITDRGPNGEGPQYDNEGTRSASKLFPSPSFQPQIALARLKHGQIEVFKTIGLKDENGKSITGLPLAPGSVGSTDEVGMDEKFHNLGYDKNGFDPEGIAIDAKGDFWVCDEYGPFIAQFNKDGRLLRKYAPGSGLPEVLKYRVPNRGFEGLTITANGKVYAAVQSPLDINGKTSKTAQFTRITELDPNTGKTKMYAYPIDVDAYKSPKDAKIGDIYAISNHKLLLIEQGKGKDKKMRNLIYLVDMRDATDISTVKIDGKEPEFTADKTRLSGIKMASKKLVVDLRELGWEVEKAEGITLLPDKKTIVITNDNDFGMTVNLTDRKNSNPEVGDYILNANGSFTYKGQLASPEITIIPNSEVERVQYLWTIELPAALQ